MNYLWISGGIVALGLIICLGSIFYAKSRKARAIKHYERIRDELTLRKEEPEEEEEVEGSSRGGFISRIIGGFVVLLVGVSLIDPIKNQLELAKNETIINANNISLVGTQVTSSWSTTILNMVPVFFALGILGVGISIAYGALKDAGLIEGEVEKKVKKLEGINHYKSVRDKLSTRKCLED